MTGQGWSITALTVSDLVAVHEIDCQSPEPWSFRQLEMELPVAGGLQLICRAQPGELPAGFLLARVMQDEAEILRLATAREFHRRGVATLLLESFIATARRRQVHRIHLELRANNGVARTLYDKFAFEMTGRRPNYYTAPNDDAICLTRSLERETHSEQH